MEDLKEIKEIKEILKILKGGQDELKKSQDELKKSQDDLKKSQDDLKKSQERLEQNQKEMKEELLEEIHEVNKRLAVFQEEITPKVNILLDADKTRQELLEIHDSEITEIREKQFNHSVRITNLEKRVIGA